MDVINDRNRHWGVSAWGQFAFTHFPDGRGYAAFLTGFFKPETLTVDQLGRLAQDALYYHEGPREPSPQRLAALLASDDDRRGRSQDRFVASLPVRNHELAGDQFASSISTGRATSASFIRSSGLIITGANSKRQPELATFSEKLMGQTVHMPISTRLQMSDERDRLSLAYNTFFSDLYIPTPTERELSLRFVITGRGRPADDPQLTLQLCLKPGETMETGAGKKITLECGADRIAISRPWRVDQPSRLEIEARSDGATGLASLPAQPIFEFS